MTYDELLKAYLDLSEEKRIAIGREKTKTLIGYLDNALKDTSFGFTAYEILISTYVGADGSIDEKEFNYIREIVGFNRDFKEFAENVISAYTDKNVEFMDKIIDASPAQIKSDFVALGLLIFSCNGEITKSEQLLLAKYAE